MARPSTAYEPRSPAQGPLYQIVRDHFETFRAQAASLRDGEGLPRFVEQAFRDFLACGWLAGGFARLHCADCGLDRLIPFSCKGRTLCPSCGGRRMAAFARDIARFGEPRRSLGGGGPSAPPICSITYSLTCPCGSGS